MNLRRKPAEEASSYTRVGVLFLQHERNSMRGGVGECQSRRVPAGADYARRWLASHLCAYHPPRCQSSSSGFPVLPRPRPIERMQIEQLECKSDLRQYVALDSPSGTDEERLDAWVSVFQRSGNREARVEVSTRSSAREYHPHRGAGRARNASGSADPARNTFSRELPMLTRIAVMIRESTRFDRP